MNKSIFSLFSFLLITLFSFAQVYSGEAAQQIKPNAQKIWLDENNNSLKYIAFTEPVQVPITMHSKWLQELHTGSDEVNYKLNRTIDDKLGQIHYRYDQYFKNHRVAGAQYILHTKNGKIQSANGEYVNTNSLSLNSNFIPKEDAYQIAKTSVPAKEYAPKQTEDLQRNEGEVVILKTKNALSFAYKFDIYALTPLARYYIYVDAKTGGILRKDDRIHEISTEGTASCKYHGVQTITVDSTSPTNFTLNDATRNIATKDLNTATNYGAAVDFTDTDNNWTTTTNQDDAALDAHYGAEMTYDFFLTKYGLNSYNGAGASINNFVHYGNGFANAFWNGTEMTYGDGDGVDYTALTSIDVVAHEISHAITEYSANLVYSYESGALNESFSDIFGVAIDFYADPANANWKMGDLFHITGDGFRDMQNPNLKSHPDTYLGTYWYTGSGDNGGVHTNSGVQNYWYYLLTEGGSGLNDLANNYNVIGIGMDDATNIAYRNLSLYLTTNSQYSDARFYAIQSAVDLFGACSQQEKSTTDAWYAVGIGALYANSVSSNFTASQTYFCTTPASVSFTNNSINDATRLWDFGDGNSSSVFNPTHTYTSPGVYTVSLITNGSSACGAASDTLTFTNYISVTNTGGPITATCIPTTNIGLSNYGIFNFTFNTINQTSLGAVEGYQDYTCAQSTSVSEGDFITVSVNTGTTVSHYVKMYLDANNDGAFATSEEIFNSYAYTNHQAPVQIPLVSAYNTPLRLRVIADRYTINNSCNSTASYSQIEDYSIVVAPISSPPITDFTSDFSTINSGSSVVYTSLSSGFPSSYLWSFPGGTPSSSTAAAPTVTYNTIGVYDAQLIATNSIGSDTELKTNYMTVTNQINMCSGPASTTAQNGLLYDSGGPSSNYSNSENCYFLIQPACADSIILSFTQFNTESGYDRLRIYDGINTAAPLIGTFQGTSIPGDLIATSGAMYVYFQSDGSVIRPGFEASWSTVSTSSAPPVANFSNSNSNPALGAPVQFTDLSTNTPIEWLWDFGDGNTSILQNPVHSYTTSGLKTVHLIAITCGFSDTTTQSINVQAAPILSVNPTSYSHTFNTCNDSTIIDFTLYNTGAGDLYIDTILGSTVGDSLQSLQYFTASGQSTFHYFNGMPSHLDSLYLTVNMDGDFDSSSENARLIIDGVDLGVIPDFNATVVNYELVLSGIQLNTFLADGNLIIEIANSNGVDVFASNGNFHELIIKYGTEADWAEIYSTGGIISAGDSMNFSIQLDNFNIVNGTYLDSISILSNYFASNPYYIPITLVNNGLANLNLSVNCLAFDSIIANDTKIDSFEISNSGCDTLFVSNISTANSSYSVNHTNFYVLPGENKNIAVSFNPSNTGNMDAILLIENSVSDTSICLTAYSTDPPIININPSQITDTASCGGIITTSFDVFNSGVGNLNFEINGNTSDSANVLVLTYGVDLSLEYPNTLSAINTYFNKYTVVESNSTLLADLQQNIIDKNVILIPEIEYNSTSHFTSFAATLNNFASNGGTVIFCGSSNANASAIFNSGLFTGNFVSNANSGNLTVNLPNHFLLDSTVLPITAANATCYYDITNIDANKVVNYGTYAAVAQRTIGSGQAILIGYDYFNTNDAANRIIANAMKSSLSGGLGFSADWLSLSTHADTLSSNDTSTITVTLDASNLYAGNYYDTIFVSSNDLGNTPVAVPVSFTVTGQAAIVANPSIFNLGALQVGASNTATLYLNNNGCDSLQISSFLATNTSYTINTSSMTIAPFSSDSVVITFTPSAIQSYNDTIYIYNNDATVFVLVNGSGVGAPAISTNPSAVVDTLFGCNDSIAVPVTIYNTGQGFLDVDILSGGSGNSANGFFDGFESGNFSTWTNESGTYIKEVVTTNPASGNYCLHFENGVGNIDDGISKTLPNLQPDEISFKVKNTVTTNFGSFVYLSNIVGNRMLVFYQSSNGKFQINGVTTTLSYTANTWHKIEYKNIDWTAKNGDIYIDDVLIYTALSFNDINVNGLDKVDLFTYSNGNCYIDDIQIGELATPDWLGLSTDSIYVPIGDSAVLNVTLDATGLISGTYTSEIVLSTNDPVTAFDTIPVSFTVLGEAEIVLNPSSLDLGTLQVGANSTATLFIENVGCDTLDITSFLASNASFTVNPSNLSISPYSSDSVVVTFVPNAIQVYNDTLYVFNNDSTAHILVNGEGVGAPVISTNPSTIIDTLFGCNDSIAVPVTIYNSGQGFLDLDILSGGSGNSANGFFDGFESGNFSTWTNNTGSYTKQVVNTGAASGSYALAFSNGTSNHLDGISKNVGMLTSDYVSFKIKSDVTDQYGSFISIQDNLGRELIFAYMGANGNYYINSGNSIAYSANVWNHFELKNIDYTSKTYELFINNTLINASMPFKNQTANNVADVFLYTWNNTTTCYFDDVQIGELATPDWLGLSTDSIYVPIGDSAVLNVTLDATDLNSGTYTSEIVLSTNDPVTPFDTIPVSFTVVGEPEIALSVNCLDFDSIVQNTTSIDSFTIYNTGCDTLFVSNISSAQTAYTANNTNFFILPEDSFTVSISFTPTSLGSFNSTLLIANSDSDTTICLSGFSTEPPVINIFPSTIVESSSCGGVITTPLSIYNSGVGDLVYTINGASSDSAHILALTNGIDYSGEYINTINAINTYYTDYTLTELNTTNLSLLQQNLVNKNVVLIPEIESGSVAYYSTFATTLQNFVNQGGTVIFCGSNSTYSNSIFGTGLFSGTTSSVINSGALTTSLPNHFLLDSTTAPYFALNATFPYDISDTDAEIVLNYNSFDVVAYRSIGSGQAIYVGFDYFATDANGSRIIANAVKSATTSGSFSSNWINLSNITDTIAANDTSVINVSLDASNLYAGVYYDTIFVASNDLANTPVAVPVQFTVTGQADISVTPNVLNFGTLQVGASYTDTVLIENLGCDTLQISSFVPTNASFTVSSASMTINPFSSDSVFITFTPNAIQTYNDTVYIYNNDTTAFVLVNGIGIGAPVITVNPNPVNDVINSCTFPVIYPLSIYNTGQAVLNWNTIANVNITDDFEGGTNSSLWASINGGVSSNSCGTNAGTGALYFNGSPRTATTIDFNTSLSSGTIAFYLKFGSGSSPCENADSGENVVLEYSTNGGASWVIMNTYLANAYNTFTQINENIPAAASSASTSFRWRQVSFSGVGNDNWVIDDVNINISNGSVLTPANGTTAIGDSTAIFLTLNAADFVGGVYTNTLYINSNDPVNPTLTIPVNLSLQALPALSVSSACISFGTLNLNTLNTNNSLLITNTGCANMFINNVYTSNPNMSASAANIILAPGASTNLNVSYTPQTPGLIDDSIYIQTNGGSEVICVNGTVLGASEIEISPNYLSQSVRLCDAIPNDTVYIKNNGITNLTWSYAQQVGQPNMSPSAGNIAAGDSTMVILSYFNLNIIGSYTYPMSINSNDPVNNTTTLLSFVEINTEPCVAFNTENISSCDGVVLFDNNSTGSIISYEWTFGDGNTSNQASPVHNYAASGNYTVALIVCGNNICDTTSQNVSISVGNTVMEAVCYPIATNPSANTGIQNVALNTLNNSTSNSLEGFQDFSCSFGTDILINQANNMTVSTFGNSNQLVRVWIDFNNDGSFSGAELVLNSFNTGTHIGTITPPSSSVINTALRMRVKSNSTSANNGPCNNPVDGQVEDYYVIVKENISPIANYNFSIGSNCSGIVNFVDNSSPQGSSWLWNFGDGNTSSLQNPTHQYVSSGNYSVSLTTTNASGSNTSTQLINVNVFNINYTYNGMLEIGQTIYFNAIGNAITSWDWNFADGNTSTLANPSNVYTNPGTYIVNLEAENEFGCSRIFIDTLVISKDVGIKDVNKHVKAYLYPNPNKGTFTFEYEGESNNLSLQIYTTTGKLVSEKRFQNNQKIKIEYNDLKLAKGLYYLEMKSEKHTKIFKFIVE